MWVPQHDTVFVKKAAAKDKTEGGIILPTGQQSLTLEGEVVISSNVSYAPGDKVLFSKFAGSEVVVGSESLLIMKVDDILAVWHDEDNGNV